MNTLTGSKTKITLKDILGGVPGLFDETVFEIEKPLSIAGIFEAVTDLAQDVKGEENKFPVKGSIEFKKAVEESEKKKESSDRIKAFFQALKEDMDRAQKAKDKLLFEEELADIVTNLPTEQKNRLLHYQLSYRDRSIYQRAELRKKLIEDRRKEEKQQKAASIPSPAKQPSALEVAFEGGSGKAGAGQANISFQAAG